MGGGNVRILRKLTFASRKGGMADCAVCCPLTSLVKLYEQKEHQKQAVGTV